MRGEGKGANALLYGVSIVALMSVASAAKAQTVLDTITVVATKTEENVWDTLAGVSAVRQEQLDQLMPTRTSDAFFGMPSVWFQQRADSPETSINIRGLQDFGRVAVIIDGARQNFQRSGHLANGTFFLEPELLAGIDVVRGPVANIYGSGAIGGVASFRTKDVDDILRPGERYGAQGHFMGADNGPMGLGSLFAAARVNPNLDVFVGGTYRSQGNYDDGNGNEVLNSAFQTATGIGKVTVRPADGHEVKFSGLHYETRFDTGQQALSQEFVYDTKVTNDIVTARWRYQRPDDKLFDFDGNVYWTGTKQDQTKTANGAAGSLGNPITGFIGDARSFKIETIGFDLHNTTRFETGAVRHALTYGGDFFEDDVNVDDPTGSANDNTPDGKRSVGGAFAQWRMNYSTWLEFIGAMRYDTYDLSGGGFSSSGDHWSPKATLGITPIAGFTVYGTFAEGYRAPAITETLVNGAHPPFAAGFPNLFTFVANPNLRPEIGQTKEVGINLKYDNIFAAGDKFRGKFNVFRNDVDDYIELFTYGPPVQFCPAPFPGCPPVPLVTLNSYSLAQYRNVSNARLEGFEFEANYDAGVWFAGLSGQRIRGKDLSNGGPLASVPPDQIATTFGMRFFDQKLTMAVRWNAVAAKKASDIPDRDGDGVPDIPATWSYNLVNLYLGYAPTPDVLASFSVENLLNEYYIPYLNGVFAAPGVTYKAGLRIRFGAS